MSQKEILLELLSGGRVVRWRDLPAIAGSPISKNTLNALIRDGVVVGEAGGYRLAEASDTTTERFTQLALRHPGGVLCLYTAMRLIDHLDPDFQMTDEVSTTDTVALDPSKNARTIGGAKILRWRQPRMLELGISETELNGNRIRYTSPERTVADLFRPKHNIPEGDAMAALAALARVGGETSIKAAMGFARELGWGVHFRSPMLATKEMLRCGPPKV